MDEPSSLQFSKYRIEEEIGRGGFGTVFRATDTTLDRPVALKILDPLLMRDRGWVERFRREARLMARLDHPHIVPIYETGTHEGRLFLAMKLIDGRDLAHRIAEDGPFSWRETLAITGQIAAALDYAHGQGLVHRDLKPSNILLANGSAVLTDFGLSILASANTMSVSLTGGVIGTPSYIPPEAWESGEVTGLADQYALACLIFEMLTGRILFTGDTPPAVMMAHYQPPEFPASWPEGVPEGIGEVLTTSLAREPQQRFGTCGELAAALRRLQSDALARPYAALQRAVQEKKWEAALDLADEIRARAPDYRDVVALENEAMDGLAADQKAAAAVQWREQAETALAVGNRAVARTAALQWQELTGDPAAAAFLQALEQPEAAPLPPPEPEISRPVSPRDSEIDQAGPPPLNKHDRPSLSEINPSWLWIGGIAGLIVIGLILWRVFSPPDTGAIVTPIPTTEVEVVVEEAMVEKPAQEEEEMPAAETDAALPVFEDVNLTIWTDRIPASDLDGLIQSFNQQFGSNIVVEEMPDLFDRLVRAENAAEAPDIVLLAHDRIGEFVVNGLLQPIDLGGKDRSFSAAAIAAFTYEGQLFGVPYAVENLGFLINTNLVGQPPRTWDEVIDIGEALMERGTVTYAIALPDTTYHIYPLLTAYGGYVFGLSSGGYNPEDLGIDGPGMIAAGNFLQENVSRGLISPSTDWETAHTLFAAGKTPYLITGPWALDLLRNSGVPFVVADFPSGTQTGFPFLGVQGFAMTALSDNLPLAAYFLTEYLATRETMQVLADVTNLPPAHVEVVSSDPDVNAFKAAGANAQPMPAIPEMALVWGSWGDAFSAIMNNELTAEEALTRSANDIRQSIRASSRD